MAQVVVVLHLLMAQVVVVVYCTIANGTSSGGGTAGKEEV